MSDSNHRYEKATWKTVVGREDRQGQHETSTSKKASEKKRSKPPSHSYRWNSASPRRPERHLLWPAEIQRRGVRGA
ncbi:unnamed protein product [Ectocarpus sp. 6 AP-2014]